MKTVSLKKPYRVDLSKPPLEREIREYTPEHLTEEIYPNQSIKAYTPEHIREEEIPEQAEEILVIADENMHIRHEILPTDRSENQRKDTVKEIVASIALVVGVIGLVVFLIWLISQNPEPVPSSAETQVAAAAENAYALVQETFDFMVENEVFVLVLAIVLLWSGIRFIRQLIDKS